MSEFKIIGRPLKLSQKIDPFNRVNSDFEELLKTVDMIPVRFSINLQQLLSDQSEKKDPSSAGYLEMKFTEIDKYKRLCSAHGLPQKMGCRIYLTDETISQEDFSNNFKNNIFEDTFNKTADVVKSYTDSVRSLGGNTGSIGDFSSILSNAGEGEGGSILSGLAKKISGLVGDGLGAIKDLLGSFGQAAGVGKGGFGDSVANMLTKGSHISLPQIWDNSTYQPSLSMNVKLISPYGSDVAIKKYVLEPLLYILLLACPTTNDGLTYGNIPYIKFRAYGIADIHLGYIQNVSIRRGGADIITNAESIPLMVDLNISIKPAFNAFAARVSANSSSDKVYVDPNSMLNGAQRMDGSESLDSINSSTTHTRSTAINSLQNIVDSFTPLKESNKLKNGGVQYINVFNNGDTNNIISQIRETLSSETASAIDLLNKISSNDNVGTMIFSMLA